ncbi:MAG TPA: DUF169 domain-containing protein [Acidobacteriota bacterium]|nr:DUF169 domain-containing protein [Acidobacteriota bacterium]
MEITRRCFIREAAVAGTLMAASRAFADATKKGSPQTMEQTEISLNAFNAYGADLEKLMYLKSYPIGIKMLKNESEIPKGAVRPRKDRGEHYAMCQVFGVARRQGMTLAMFLEDHWCFEPIISYGLVETPQDYLDGSTNSYFIANKEAAAKHAREMTRLPVGKYAGMVVGPLKTANYAPDLAMMYANTAQLRHLLLCLRYLNGTQVTSTIDPIGSCVHSVVPSLLKGECEVTVPDPGDFERAGAQDDEMILTVPAKKLPELMEGVYHFEKSGMGFRRFSYAVHPDFKQPPFYEEYFKKWGLDAPSK